MEKETKRGDRKRRKRDKPVAKYIDESIIRDG